MQVDSVEFLGMKIWCSKGLDHKDEQIYGIECMEKHEGYATLKNYKKI